MISLSSVMDRAGDGAGSVGLPEMALLPIHLAAGSALGQRHLPQGGQRHKCGAEEEGGGGGTLMTDWNAGDKFSIDRKQGKMLVYYCIYT